MLKALTLAAISFSASVSVYTSADECPASFDKAFRKLHSKDSAQLCELYQQSKALVLVNTASNCGFTKQFTELEALHKKYKNNGLVIVGFPSNSFRQEEKEEEETARVCFQNFGVTFTMTEHVPVKGDNAIAPFKYVAQKTKAPSWNFNKYLVTKDGSVQHFGSRVTPLGSDLETAIAKALDPAP